MLETLETIVTTEICPDCHSTQCVREAELAEFDEFDNYLMPECDIDAVCYYGNDCGAHKEWLA